MEKPVIGIDASRANRAQRTGVEWYAFHLIQELKRIVPPAYRVVLYTEEPLRDGLEDLPPHWENRVLRWPPRRLWTQVRLSWEMFRRPPDLFFVPAHVIPMVTPKRTLTTLHDVAFMALPDAYRPAGREYLKLMYRRAAKRTRILTVSEFSKGEIVRYFGADPDRITAIPLGFDGRRFGTATDDEIRARLHAYGIRRPYFLFVGRLESKKNLRGLLESFRRFRATRPGDESKLVLVGKTGYGYHHEMRSLGEDEKLSVLQKGYVEPDDMRYFYGGATAFVFPSRYEGFGIPLLEAFACGTPVIASDVTSIPEVAGEAALYVDPNDTDGIAAAMARVADEPALRADLAAKGFSRVKRFSWEATARRTWEVMQDMLKE
ncbi:MAG TPA: glycosyltransferase family 1 protein [Candidatus Eisenbacteria bacterium]|jgi:glycosyltransferase involved in cell wall biosynthesis|nr:glycosyltransferase family 1 protein [Candidatus Eisenbacteria bacterium]